MLCDMFNVYRNIYLEIGYIYKALQCKVLKLYEVNVIRNKYICVCTGKPYMGIIESFTSKYAL